MSNEAEQLFAALLFDPELVRRVPVVVTAATSPTVLVPCPVCRGPGEHGGRKVPTMPPALRLVELVRHDHLFGLVWQGRCPTCSVLLYATWKGGKR